jgi:hypothetical protein
MENKKSAVETLREDMAKILASHHRQEISERIKRGIQAKKLRNPNPKNFNQFILKRELEDNILLYPFTSNDMEEIASKPLDTKYLYRIYIGLTCFEDIQEKIREINHKVVEYALDDTEPMWEQIDDNYFRQYGRKQKTRLVNQSKV